MESDIDCGGPNCTACAETKRCKTNADCAEDLFCDSAKKCARAESCDELLSKRPFTTTGVHTLRSTRTNASYQTLCELVLESGSQRAWTLVLRADGNKDTFLYDKPIWTDFSVLNVTQAQIEDKNTEVKLESFSSVSFNRLALVAHGATETRLVANSPQSNSVKDLVSQSTFTAIANDRNAFAVIDGFLPRDTVLTGCINGVTSYTRSDGMNNLLMGVRIGVISDEVMPDASGRCPNPNTFVGIGGGGEGIFDKTTKPPAAGSYCNIDDDCDPATIVKARVSIFVR
jgi:hypothetical protein